MKKLLLLATLSILFISCASNPTINTNNTTVTQESIKNIDIPFKDHGYSQYSSRVITSQKAFDTFIMQINNSNNWNRKTEVLEELKNAEIDFKNNNLLFYRITRGSGSIHLNVDNNILLKNNNITIKIEETRPNMGTADMAYYALAYKVDKAIGTITFDNKIQKVIVENIQSDMIVPKNCKAWFDGCNNCSKIGQSTGAVCTQMACFAYNPQNFRCTSWEK